MKPSNEAMGAIETIEAKIFRFDPTVDRAPRYETYSVPSRPDMRILDVLDYVREERGVDIGYRWFCGVKKCGTCGVMVNGRAALACWEPARPKMVIEPLNNLPVIRDLLVDRSSYDKKLQEYASFFLERKAPYAGFPEPLTEAQFEPTDRLRDCIQCLCCYAACPVIGLRDTGFAGPVALVQHALVTLDPRDESANHIATAARRMEVFKCVSCYACESACPSEIPIVAHAIEPLKQLIHRNHETPGTRHGKVFADIVRRLGEIDGPLLVLRTRGFGRQGLRALMSGFTMMLRGKVNPLRSLFRKPTAAAQEIGKLFELVRRQK